MATVDLMNELAEAVVDCVTTDEDYFLPALGEHSVEGIKVEYARDGVQAFIKGPDGSCTVYIGDLADGRKLGASAMSRVEIEMRFDLIETKDNPKRKSWIQQAVLSVFGENGDNLFDALADSGSNVLGGTRQCEITGTQEQQGRGPANVVYVVTLAISFWHKVPLVREV